MGTSIFDRMNEELQLLKTKNNFRTLPRLVHKGRKVKAHEEALLFPESGTELLNLSSNDYLGLASDRALRGEFFSTLTAGTWLASSSSSRLLTGNYTVYEELENLLAASYGTESSLVFNSGYHANVGILPAVSDSKTLILADKLVHASLIDGIRLSAAQCIRFRHNGYEQLERLVEENHSRYETIILVTESIFSMDGDEADLPRLVALKRRFPNLLLYVDEAHAFGVRGKKGLGCAEEANCIGEIDFLVGTFGKAAASTGAFVVCKQVVREYLINRMRTFIFTTALPPVLMEWTRFVISRLPEFTVQRKNLVLHSRILREALIEKGFACPSTSHIIPLLTGDSTAAVHLAGEMQRKGFYVLPVRPPTVPEGTSRIRISLTADVRKEEIEEFITLVPSKNTL